MKLDFESNTSTFTPIVSDFSVRAESDNSVEVSKMLREGIEAAQTGKAAEARSLLLRVTEVEPDNEKAWLWLASISEYPEELLVFLNSVLKINPANERAVEWAKATKSLLSKTFVQRGIDAAGDQDDFARQCFLQAIIHDKENEMAWLWMASVSSSEEEKSAHLEKVLGINPDNPTAKSLLESIHRKNNEMLFRKVVEFAANDENNLALDALQDYFRQSPETENAWLLKSFLVGSINEKLVCLDKVLEVNPENVPARMNSEFLRSMLEKPKSEESESQAQISEPGEVSMTEANSSDYEFSEEIKFEADSKAEVEEVFTAEDNSSQDPEISLSPAQTETVWEIENDAPQDEFSEPMPLAETEPNKAEEENFAAPTELPQDSELESKVGETGYAFYDVKEETDDFSQTSVFYNDESEDDDYVKAEYENNPNAYEEVQELPQVYAFQENSDVSEQLGFADDVADLEKVQLEEAAPENYSKNEPIAVDSLEVLEIEDNETIAENNYLGKFEDEENTVADSSAAFEETVINFQKDASQHENVNVAEQAESPNYSDEEDVLEPFAEMIACSFCEVENELQAFICRSCRAVLTLSDLEMVLGNQVADKEMIGNSVYQLEAEKERRELQSDEMKQLALGYLNLGNLPKGINFLNEAAKMNPNDIVLSSQVNALKIRLSEIEKQKDIQNLMPKNLTILVVDDSATVRKLISGKLEKSGHEVVCAMDGIDALEKIKEIVPDLVLLDINMPRMDGYQVCKMIRANEATKDVPVVMISGKDGFFDKVRGRMAGTTGYITKPFGPETLMKTVETYIV